MHIFKTLLAGASVLAVVAAQSSLMITSTFTSVKAGEPVQITWSGGDLNAPVTLILRAGDPGNLATVETITTSGSGGSYSWIPSKDLPSLSGYAVEIKQGGLDNFSGQFSISGGSGSALPSGSATLTSPSNSTATTTSSSSSSSSTSTSSGNLTTTTTTLKTTSSTAGYTKTVAAPTGSSTVAPNANTAAGFASPLALVLGAVMAMIYFN